MFLLRPTQAETDVSTDSPAAEHWRKGDQEPSKKVKRVEVKAKCESTDLAFILPDALFFTDLHLVSQTNR